LEKALEKALEKEKEKEKEKALEKEKGKDKEKEKEKEKDLFWCGNPSNGIPFLCRRSISWGSAFHGTRLR